jgi:hypothetical protein
MDDTTSRERREAQRLAERLDGGRTLVDASDLSVAELLAGAAQNEDDELLDRAWGRIAAAPVPRRRRRRVAAPLAAALAAAACLALAFSSPPLAEPAAPVPAAIARDALTALGSRDAPAPERLRALQALADVQRRHVVAELAHAR